MVVRFNDMKNMQRGERCDLHVVRWNGASWWGIQNPPAYVTDAPLVVIGRNARVLVPAQRGIHDTIDSFMDAYDGQCAAPGDWGFSSGTVVLSYLQALSNVQRIDVFGMNFKFRTDVDTGHSRRERTCNHAHCTKCVFHDPPTDSYLPRNWTG